MIRFIYILFFVFFGNIGYISAQTELPKDTVPVEMFRLDSDLIKDFRSKKEFNYENQYRPQESDWAARLERMIYDWFRKNLNPNLSKSQFDNILIVGLIILLALLILVLYIYKPSLFYLNRKTKLKYQIEDEDIENLNISVLIKKALERKEYTEAIRWRYMQVLQVLNEKEIISFDPNKTVNEYAYEIAKIKLRNEFKRLSNLFVYYRYGNGEAFIESYQHFDKLSDELVEQLYK